MKTLFIQIDNTPFPKGCSYDTEIIDCKENNEFLSFIAYEITKDIWVKGKPLYTMMEVTEIFQEYRNAHPSETNELLSYWHAMLGKLLDKGNANEQFELPLQDHFVRWCLTNEDKNIQLIGDWLSHNHTLLLDSEGLYDDVVSCLHRKLTLFYQKQPNAEYVVFSNPIISNSSQITKTMKHLVPDIRLLPYNQWNATLLEKQKRINNLDDISAFTIDGIVLGVTTEEELKKIPNIKKYGNSFCHKRCFYECDKGKVHRIITYFNHPLVDSSNIILNRLMDKDVNCDNLSYNDIYNHLSSKGFIEGKCPELNIKPIYLTFPFDSLSHRRSNKIVKKGVNAILCKSTPHFCIYLDFFDDSYPFFIESYLEKTRTLRRILIISK